ncbi:glycosyltransferase family 4 protein [Psychroserpens sp. SPM9]|uniref:glycosyltransferase family 4 protein n=1 Tax=Psychroserpens sp. SPM9 TaxID=2975598 RepID=UPI0021A5886B|nr:glycosyltransferase family 4 protein [Psychroserpens sp. SPM9]MDG5492243.1 glycosyltransferase family 4 protein [Psychroserpens sp. SPM9]
MHLVKFLGHPDQPYMQTLFNALSLEKSTLSHTVFCVKNLGKTSNIPYQQIGKPSHIFKPKTAGFIGSQLLFSKGDMAVFNSETLKNRIKLLIKWEQVLRTNSDVLHVHNLHMVPLEVLKFLKSKNTKMLVSLRGRDLVVETLNETSRAIFLEKMECFTNIHVNSQYLKELAQERGIESQKIKVIYRGVEPDLYQKENYNHKELPTSDQAIKLISVGRLEWEKGQWYILDSIYRLKNKGVNVFCDIYGDGRFREFLEFRIAQLKLQDHVRLLGYMKNEALRKTYKTYHLAVQCSIYESLPNGLIEMCLHNLPCVTSNVGGIPEFLSHGINGISFDINSPENLDAAILECLTLDKEKLQEFNQKVTEKFSFNKGVKQLNELYTELNS